MLISRPVLALLVGVLFAVVSVVYGALSRDWGGTTLMALLGVAMGVMAYSLAAGSPRGDDSP